MVLVIGVHWELSYIRQNGDRKMKKIKDYNNIIISKDNINQAIKIIYHFLRKEDVLNCNYSISQSDVSWEYDSPDEFISNYLEEMKALFIYFNHKEAIIVINYKFPKMYFSISSSNKERIYTISNSLEEIFDKCGKIQKENIPIILPKIFIGHGGSSQWRDLKDHLHDLHKYEVVAYETGERAGHAIRDVISEFLDSSSFAILVMTAEDRTEEGNYRARQNVIHEIGLFQGRLGFSKAIVLKEEGVEEFSNISGIQQIRYSRGKIKETFGDVLAALKREFPNAL
jgi:predicted nucleotide-binding protein